MSLNVGFSDSIARGDRTSSKFSGVEAFDDYFNLSGRKYRVIRGVEGSEKDFVVQEEIGNSNVGLSILKVLSYFTGIIPLIMLVGKAIARGGYNFQSIEKTAVSIQTAGRAYLARKELKKRLANQKAAKAELSLIAGREKMLLASMQQDLAMMQEKFPAMAKSPGNLQTLNLLLGKFLIHIGKSTKIVKQLESLNSDQGIAEGTPDTVKLRIRATRLMEYMKTPEFGQYLSSTVQASLYSDAITQLLDASKLAELSRAKGWKGSSPFTTLSEHALAHATSLRALRKNFLEMNFDKEADSVLAAIEKNEGILEQSFAAHQALGQEGKKQKALFDAEIAKFRATEEKETLKGLAKTIFGLKREIEKTDLPPDPAPLDKIEQAMSRLEAYGFVRKSAPVSSEGGSLSSVRASLAKALEFVDRKYEEAKCSQLIAKVECLRLRGAQFSSDKGATKTLKLKDEKGKLLGVFKPGAEGADVGMQVKTFVKKNFGAQLSILKDDPQVQPNGERLAYLIDRHFGFHVVPPSRSMTLGDKVGAFQMAAQIYKKCKDHSYKKSTEIAKGLKEAKQEESVLNKKTFTLEEIERFQLFALHDFLIGNLDGHSENWFVEAKNDTLDDIIGIDKANSFPVENPKEDAISGLNQYKWRKFEIAKQAFTPKVIQLMLSITEESIEEFLGTLKKEGILSSFLNAEMKARLLERVNAIQYVAKLKDGATPLHLAAFRTDEMLKAAKSH